MGYCVAEKCVYRSCCLLGVIQIQINVEENNMNLLSKIIIVFTVLLFAGCASLPSPDQMRAEVADYQLPKTPEEGKAIVYMVRPASLGALIRFNVFVDNQQPESEMGYTRGSQYIYFNLEPGDHQILSKAENWAEANITAAAGDIIFIRQEPTMGFLMAQNSIFKIQDYEGKYHVKHLDLGTIIKTDK